LTRHSQKCGGIVELVLADFFILKCLTKKRTAGKRRRNNVLDTAQQGLGMSSNKGQ
jgi:hypothetical protein